MDTPHGVRPKGRATTAEASARPTTRTRPARPSFGDYHPDDVVSRKIAAALLGVSPRTTEDWARAGKGPPLRKLGSARSCRVLYRVGDLLEWLDAQTRASTTTGPEAA